MEEGVFWVDYQLVMEVEKKYSTDYPIAAECIVHCNHYYSHSFGPVMRHVVDDVNYNVHLLLVFDYNFH